VDIAELGRHWDEFAKKDPFWAILTSPHTKGNRWDRGQFFATGVTEVAELLAYLQSSGFSFPRRRALDFGCGVGRLTQALALHFDEVIGLDISPTFVELASQYNVHGSRCRFYVNEVANLHLFGSDSFDFIYASKTLQHMHPRYMQGYLAEFMRLLTHQGLAAFEIPTERKGVASRIQQTLARHAPVTIVKFYRAKRYDKGPRMEMYGMKQAEVIQVVRDSGGQIVGTREYPGLGWHGIQYYVAKTASSPDF
jgi:ubiquinone/menaquinone biosynthesis C-methylase UbiE